MNTACVHQILRIGNSNSDFHHLLFMFVLLTEYFKTQEKIKVALITVEVLKTETEKQ